MDYKYRKKPVVIEAFQMTKERRASTTAWPIWLIKANYRNRGMPGSLQRVEASKPESLFEIVTLEGNHLVSEDDFIIRGVQGELYPCKPDIFERTYDPYTA